MEQESSRWDVRGLWDVLGLPGVALLAYLSYLSWPACMLFALSGTGWVLMRKRDGLLAQLTAELLLPVSIATGLLTAVLIFLNLLGLTLSQDQLAVGEDRIVSSWLRLRDVQKHLGGASLTAILLALFGITVLVPRLGLVSRFVTAKKALRRLTLALLVLIQFTMLGSFKVPPMLARRHDEIVWLYRVSLYREAENISRTLAAKSLSAELPQLDDDGLLYLRATLSSADGQLYSWWSPYRDAFASGLALHQFRQGLPEGTSRASLEQDARDFSPRVPHKITREPETANAYAHQLRALGTQQARAEQSRLVAREAVEALRSSFAEFIKAGGRSQIQAVPASDSLATEYVDTLVGELAKFVFSRTVVPALQQSLEKNTARMRETLALDTLLPASTLAARLVVIEPMMSVARRGLEKAPDVVRRNVMIQRAADESVMRMREQIDKIVEKRQVELARRAERWERGTEYRPGARPPMRGRLLVR